MSSATGLPLAAPISLLLHCTSRIPAQSGLALARLGGSWSALLPPWRCDHSPAAGGLVSTALSAMALDDEVTEGVTTEAVTRVRGRCPAGVTCRVPATLSRGSAPRARGHKAAGLHSTDTACVQLPQDAAISRQVCGGGRLERGEDPADAKALLVQVQANLRLQQYEQVRRQPATKVLSWAVWQR